MSEFVKNVGKAMIMAAALGIVNQLLNRYAPKAFKMIDDKISA